MHVAELQSKPPAMPKSADTGHAFVPATSRVMTLAEAAAMTEQLRHCEQAVNQEVIYIHQLLVGTVAQCIACPRSGVNDVALQDCQDYHIGRPYRDPQDRLLWKYKTCPART